MQRKFVITSDGVLRFGYVDRHYDLLPIGQDECFGGGLWLIDTARGIVVLYGRSFDYGTPDFSRVRRVEYEQSGIPRLPLLYYPNWPDQSIVEPVL